MKKMRFGVIGVGNIAPIHAEAIQGTPGAELVAAATRSEERGRAFARKFHAAWVGDYGDLLRREDVDVVTLCTPHDLHATMTIDAAAAGKRVLCEKPMARSVAECSAMIEAIYRSARAGAPVILPL